MTQTREIRLKARPDGPATRDNFDMITRTLPPPKAGELLVRVIWLSLDPYMRGRMDAGKSYAAPVEIGEVMTAQAVGEVVQSNHDRFVHGDVVMGPFGWADHAISDGIGVVKVPAGAPISTALGVLGMPGMTAWTGLTEIAKAKPRETVVVSAATGAVGATAGQLAKARGMRVVGVAGGAEKCAFAVDELGYDSCLDHRSLDRKSLAAGIRDAAPDGVDVYFENVGGKTLSATLGNMNDFGRIAVCGMIAWYSGQNLDEAAPLPLVWRNILTRKLSVQGFIVTDHFDRWGAFYKEVAPMVMDGRITMREDVTNGIENAPDAFFRMLEGRNFGKTLVRVGPDP